MTGQLGLIAFVVWRESVEALLVVGVLNAWLVHKAVGVDTGRARLFLWGGVAGGLAVACAFAFALVGFEDLFGEEGQDYFQIVMVFLAAALILQMVVWMRRHGAGLKTELETGLSTASQRQNWWGVAFLALAAVAREGSETVVFLYGTVTSLAGSALLAAVGASLLGLILAIATYGLLQLGGKLLSWRLFFRLTEIMLLFLAASMVVTGVDRLVGLDIVPLLSRPLWDTSALLDDTRPLGGILAALTGYRARPDLTQIAAFALFWLVAWVACRPATRPARPVA
jgi:high-affinity iron transporter